MSARRLNAGLFHPLKDAHLFHRLLVKPWKVPPVIIRTRRVVRQYGAHIFFWHRRGNLAVAQIGNAVLVKGKAYIWTGGLLVRKSGPSPHAILSVKQTGAHKLAMSGNRKTEAPQFRRQIPFKERMQMGTKIAITIIRLFHQIYRWSLMTPLVNGQ